MRPFNAYNEKIARGIPIDPPNAKVNHPHLLLGQMRDDEMPAVYRCPDIVRTNGMWDAEVAFDAASKSLSGMVGADGDALFLLRITLVERFNYSREGVTLIDTALTETNSTVDGQAAVLHWAHLLLAIKQGATFEVTGSHKPLQGKWDGRNLTWGWAPTSDRATVIPGLPTSLVLEPPPRRLHCNGAALRPKIFFKKSSHYCIDKKKESSIYSANICSQCSNLWQTQASEPVP